MIIDKGYTMSRRIVIGVIGGGEISAVESKTAFDVGCHIALRGATLVCGGLGGIMEAASRGCAENGGTVIGILPGERKDDANPYVTIALPSGMGAGRNVLVTHAADVLIAFPGSYGTLSEMALALVLGKTVVCMPGSWDLPRTGSADAGLVKEAFDAVQAVGIALASVSI